MRQSKLIGKTIKENPKGAQTAAQRLTLRAGYIKKVSGGQYVYMPLFFRTITKIAQIIREEMQALGYEEFLMPALKPMEIEGIKRKFWRVSLRASSDLL